ncbi:hypothetical protein HMPREF1254_1247 [Prevotella sp. BV3P1]|uniref:Uncharacterized protein n=1 Tax=Prevotella bivia TaxID=28125 RepID=A0A137SSX8_9BACT|nr:hypothetical protein HMPREF1254_1247 [Prevotella sp. BV3P1]KXB79803.1 hypothetical protein HMPREF3034_02065 [Prevotella sp. DNF00663]KXO15493.1 hypothetical protein HMPREF3202_01720 [Prevotella bivia]
MSYAARLRFCSIKPLLLQRAEKTPKSFFLDKKNAMPQMPVMS